MKVYLKELPSGSVFDNIEGLQDAELTFVRLFKSANRVEVGLHVPNILSYQDYHAFTDAMQSLLPSSVIPFITADQIRIREPELLKFLEDLYEEDSGQAFLRSASLHLDAASNRLEFRFMNADDAGRASRLLADTGKYLARIGYQNLELSAGVMEIASPRVEDAKVERPAHEQNRQPEKKERKFHKQKKDDYPVISLKDISDPTENIQFEGQVFACDEVVVKSTQKLIKSLSVFDGTDAMAVKCFEGRYFEREELDAVKPGQRVKVFGSVIFDNYSKDLVVSATALELLDPVKDVDTAKEKRVELHAHTNMSEMDGVCEGAEMVKYAFNLGHDGICITDHCDVQSFVKAYNTAQSLKKGTDRSFKVGLGCEMNMVDDHLTIVRNPVDTDLLEGTYVSFDLETTGLSCKYDSIIEFGAVRVKNSTVTDRKQIFIKPPIPIPAYITRKTNITNDMVKNARTFAEAADEILEWIGDDILVAHNATFDYYFMNEELRRIGRKPLKNPVIDTLDMARAILKERHFYRLGNISNYYRIQYDEEVAHRADYDADVLSSVFMCLLKDARKAGAKTVRDLQDKIQDEDAYKKVRRSHIIVLCRNHDGLKRLYELVTESSTKTLAVMGKSSGKDGAGAAAEPRIRRSSVDLDRSNILVGTSCLNNEVWELGCNGDDERLEEAMKWYDFVELQPPGNYSTSVVTGSIPSMDRVREVQKRIIACARKLGKPVVADSDAHYCRKDQKIFRDVYIMSQGVGGVAHPLYIRDEQLRMRTKNPDQHIRLTQEMTDEFDYLNDDSLVHEIVIENPHKIFDMLDEIRPVPAGTFPPSIEGSDDKLREICHRTEREMYEFEGKVPEIVSTRLSDELDNIIRNGFGVHYYIAHLLVKKSNSDGYVVGSRGSVGSSFTATMSGITEVNPLPPHYLCPHCHYSEFLPDGECAGGFDLPDKVCPHCGTVMRGNGHNIPFQTFLGFNADKTPDIDLNFSNEYQARAHAFIKEVFGETHAFRAGTIGTVAEKTAYGYVSGYCEKMNITNMRRTMKDYLANGCQNVKRTTGQHPGGIIIIPENYTAEDFTPVQYPANDPESEWKTTHYDFHDIHDNVLKFDILGHVDPTAMRLMQNIADVKPLDIPMNDPETLSLFYSDDALHADPRIYKKETGALGLPEFGTKTTRGVLEETRPRKFSDLVIISGLSHGTDVWAGNAQDLIRQGHPIDEVIGCRDDIMTYLMQKGLEPIDAFHIMEKVRKGKGVDEKFEKNMIEHNVPEWYIDSCKKIKYMFPKAHAVAYVMMAVRIAWYKVHEPLHFYIQFFTLRCDAYEIETMSKGIEAVRDRMADIQGRMQNRFSLNPVSNKEKALFDTLEVCEELYARGFRIGNVDLYKSKGTEFTVDPDDSRCIIPPFIVIDGLGANVARSVEEARNRAEFLSEEDILKRTLLSDTLLRKLKSLGCLHGLQERNQMSLF
ncbi:MAG: PolC-type DNA polymerase III [Solobacterium sp.]|nr:PolC-type DNA polymerase III [Solobacterium sp.]